MNVILWAIGAGWVVLLGVVGVVSVLLVVVLRQATRLRSDMEAVI